MAERHQPRGKQILTTGLVVIALCGVAIFIPADWLTRIGQLFGTNDAARTDAFTGEVAALDAALERGDASSAPQLEPYVAARRLTRAGPMTPDEVAEAAQIWRSTSTEPDLIERLAARFPRLDATKVATEIDALRQQLGQPPPGGKPANDCASCHRETMLLPGGRTFDAAGIYPFAADTPEFDSGRRVPLLSEAIELALDREQRACLDCHVPHGAAGFAVDQQQRIDNMGLWVSAEPAPDNVLHVRVKLKNAASGHLAPAGRVAPAYVVTVEARQRRQPLRQRFGTRLPAYLQNERFEAGLVFARDFRGADGRPTSDPGAIVDLVADTRLESGRFLQSDFLFDRIDTSTAHLDVTLWHLPDVTTWQGAKAIRRADKPEPQVP